MDDPALKIQVQQEATSTVRRRRKGAPWLLLAGGLVVVAGALVGVLMWPDRDQQEEKPNLIAGPLPKSIQELAALAAADEASVDVTVADDGETLWISPTAGEPLELNYLLPGTQLVLHVRVADLLAHDEGNKVLDALGPWGLDARERLTHLTGVQLAEIETLSLGVRLAQAGNLEYAMCLRLQRAFSEAELEQRLPQRASCFAPSREAGKVVVVCSESAVPELRAEQGQPPLFPRELQRVLQRTDARRTATVVFAGKFLQIGGKKMVQGTGELLRQALIDFLGDEATATTLSLHWDENFFLELQSTVVLNERPHRFAVLLAKRLAASSDQVEDVVFSQPRHPYGRKVLARFPAMLRKLSNYTRSAEVEDLSVVRCYLPVTAGHNLLMATELLLNSPQSGDAVTSGNPAGPVAERSQSINERLQQLTSLVFPQETLQKSLEMLSEDIGVPLEIAGRDLQLEGITKNQSFAIALRDRPAAEILLAILLQANPDRTASGPTDAKQKLVYVIRKSAENPRGVIVVTTRSAAERRGEKLPAVFVPVGR